MRNIRSILKQWALTAPLIAGAAPVPVIAGDEAARALPPARKRQRPRMREHPARR